MARGGSEVGPSLWLRLGIVAAVTSITQVALTIAFTSLLFRDGLADDLGLGILVMFTGLAIAALVGAVFSGLGGHLVGPQDTGLIVLSVALPAIVAGAGDAAGPTAVVLLGIGSLAVGVTLLLLGRLGLGRLIRYMPFPVVAGFMAGTGLVMARSSLDLAADGISGAASGGGEQTVRIAVAVAVAVLMIGIARSSLPAEWLMPGLVLGAIAVFNGARFAAGIGRDSGAERGWLLPTLPEGTLMTTTPVGIVRDAHWPTVFDQLPTLLPLLVLAPVTLLLYLGALETSLEVEIDSDREFRIIGSANLGVGLVGSGTAYTQFANTMLIQRMAGRHRSIPMMIGVAAVAVLAVGDAIVSLIPQPIVAGMLGFIALSFILDWMWDLRHRVRPIELVLAALIALSIPVLGFIAGVVIGMLLAAGWFILQYSRISGVRRVLDATFLHSHVDRDRAIDEALRRRGNEVLVVELDGFLFFGTGDAVMRAVTARAERADVAIRWLVLDFSRVTGADSSAAASFAPVIRWAERVGIEIGWCGMRTDVERALSAVLAEHSAADVFIDLDRAIEWTEAGRLADVEELPDIGGGILDDLPALRDHVEALDFEPGEHLFDAGAPGTGLMIIDSGRVVVLGDRPASRRRELGRGAALGEIGLYRDAVASATVVADEPCRVLVLDRAALERLGRSDPDLALDLHRHLAGTLAIRLLEAQAELDSLRDDPVVASGGGGRESNPPDGDRPSRPL